MGPNGILAKLYNNKSWKINYQQRKALREFFINMTALFPEPRVTESDTGSIVGRMPPHTEASALLSSIGKK